jgi:hypothetical protein
MSRFNAERLKVASAVQKDLATPNVISREQARLYNSTFHQPLQSTKPVPESFEARLTRVFPANSPVIFSVLPCELPDRIAWLDAAGYMLAESNKPSIWHDTLANKRDFYLDIRQRSIVADEF